MARLPLWTVFLIDHLGRKPFLGLLGGGWTSPGVPFIKLTLHNTAPESVKWLTNGSHVDVEMSREVVLEVFAQLTMFLAEFDELRRMNNWENKVTAEGASLIAEHNLGLKPKDDRFHLKLPQASTALTVNVEADLIEIRASEAAAQRLADALKSAVARQRAERSMKALEEIP